MKKILAFLSLISVVISAMSMSTIEYANAVEDTMNQIEGDVNGDGRFNIADVVLFQKWLLAVPGINLNNWKDADFDGNNQLDTFDLIFMKRKLIQDNATPVTPVVPPNNSLHFDSYDDLALNLISNKTDMMVRNFQQNGKNVADSLQKFLSDRKDTGTIKIPYIGEKPAQLLNEVGYHNITFQANELYNQPWLFYFLPTKGTNSYIKTMYLDEEVALQASENGAMWFLNTSRPAYLDENAVYPPYVSMKEENIATQDRTVKAVIGRYDDDPRVYINFTNDDLFVIVCCSEDMYNENFTEQLSFRDLQLTT